MFVYMHTHSSILSGTSTRVMPEIDVLSALPGLHPKQPPPPKKKKTLRALADLQLAHSKISVFRAN